jgi:uncharacterized protein YndB with AHSA1/START domain
METLTFKTIINAPKEKVWDTMLGDATYRQWTAAFHEGSYYKGSWEQGSKIKFLGPNEDGTEGGMYAIIEANRPYEFISIKHLGELQGDVEKPWPTDKGQEGYENYTFKDMNGSTELIVDLRIPAEFKDMFQGMWPNALEKLKAIAEN